MQTDFPEPEPFLDHNEAWAEKRNAHSRDSLLRRSGARVVERRRGQEPIWEWMGQRYRESELAKMLLEPIRHRAEAVDSVFGADSIHGAQAG